jgi:hypothetical protein
MHPPEFVLRKVQELHPQARIGWLGAERKDADDLNAGTFVLLQLYHARDASNTYLEHWNDKGPVYGKPYDRLSRVPVWVKNYSKEDVFSGKIIADIRTMVETTVKERYVKSALEKGAEQAAKMKDLAGAAGEYVWKRSQKRDNAMPNARKFIPKQQMEIKRSADDLKTAFLPQPTAAAPLR